MTQTIEATYENGVFVPVRLPLLAEHVRVRLTIETVPAADSGTLDLIRYRRENQLSIDPISAAEIALDPELEMINLP